jgi:sulfite exporter TauE/SafE
MLYTAFLIGLAGSLHCVGMCGPIALALPVNFNTRVSMALSRLLYNLGRIVTYTLMGGIFGLLGKGFAMAGLQQALSIVLGVALLIIALGTADPEKHLVSLGPVNKLNIKLKRALGKLFSISSQSSLFAIGLLNGLLPCGFVYLGIFGALNTSGPLEGMAYMALFGLGTLPLMLAVSMAGTLVTSKVKVSARRLFPALMIVFAVLFITRGLNLGIPYLSPKISGTQIGNTKCH